MDSLSTRPNPLAQVAKWIAICLVVYAIMLWLGAEGLIWILTNIRPSPIDTPDLGGFISGPSS